jgi:DNA-binding response OmpR family regulator
VLVVAPPPAHSAAYVSVLEAEGFDVLLAKDLLAAESLLRSTTPQFILAVTPTLSPDVVQAWKDIAPQAEVRVIPGLMPMLEEFWVHPRDLLDFMVNVMSEVSGIVLTPRGISGDRTRQVLHLAEAAAESLGFNPSEATTVRISAVLSGVAESFHSEGSPSNEEGQAEADSVSRRAALARFSQAMKCPFPLGAEPPSGPLSSRAPSHEEVVEAASRFVDLLEQNDSDPAQTMRQLTVEQEAEGTVLHPAAVEAILAATNDGHRQLRARILLVDDDLRSRSLLALRLSNEGYSVCTESDGRKALEEVHDESPSLILSETVLPSLDGYALLDALKHEGKGDIPFLFISSRADPASVNKGLLLGAADYLAKPVDFEVLLTKLDLCLSHQARPGQASAPADLAEGTWGVNESGQPLASYYDLQQGSVILGRFRIEEELGEGGMGKVFKAHDERLEEPVVLKVVKPQISEDEVLERFKQEIRLARKITHPGIVRIFDFWEAGPIKFVTMEYLEGSNLRQEMKRRGGFPVPVALRVATEMFEALGAAHDAGVAHRDMKPHNVLMLPTGNVKLLDFGIAQLLEQSQEESAAPGHILGTPAYMSPEQLVADPLDPRSDLYSAGVVLYELLTERLPFRADDSKELARMHLTAEPDPPSTWNRKIPAELDALLMRLLQKAKEHRYPTAQTVAAELTKIRKKLG